MSRTRVVAATVGVVVAALVALFALSPDDTERTGGAPLVGRLAPAIEATTTSGEAFDLDELRGGWVLVNFFATWCGPCKAEHPELVSFAQRNEGRASVVSVSFNDDAEKVRAFFDANGGDWPVIAQGNGAIALDYGVVKMPESYLVAPDGRVAAKFNGGVTVSGVEGVMSRAEGSGS